LLPNKWDIYSLLVLSYYKGLTSDIIKEIVEKYDSLDHLMNAELPQQLNLILHQGELFKKASKIPEKEAEKQLKLAEDSEIEIITFWDDRYPYLLKQIYESPPFIFVKGKLQIADIPSISIVGTRKCSQYGRIMGERFSEYFAAKGVVIVSGLAYGIDSIAHLSAVNAGGITYSVIASGIDKLSPSTSVKNSEKIIENGGAIISIFKCGVRAFPSFFLQRNRIISGMSKATLIIESKYKGGSLNTAKFANAQNRDVFAVPGNIGAKNSEGTNNLIKKNLAAIATSPESLFEEIGYDGYSNLSLIEMPENKLINEEERLIFKNLDYNPIHIDNLALKVGMDMPQLLVVLLNMEFSNSIKQLPGKYYIRA